MQTEGDALNSQPVSTQTPSRPQRVFLITWYKAGSQWVRDLLTHHLAAAASGLNNSQTSFDCLQADATSRHHWPEVAAGSFIGPVYQAGPNDWERNRRPGDKAVVVLRDPRDIAVSMMYSLMLSHEPTAVTARLRAGLLCLPPAQRLMLSMLQFRRPKVFADWCENGWGPHASFLLTSYERLLADTHSELAAIFEFLNWKIPHADLHQIVTDMSFECRSGRSRGHENHFSHWRKGVSGDWKNHFDRLTGLSFELYTGGALVRTGYAADAKWYEVLPESALGSPDLESVRSLQTQLELQAELVRLREETLWLRQALAQLDAA